MPNIDRIDGYADELTAIRRDLHAHPEIGFEEVRTSGIVADKMKQWGIEVHRGLGGTGVVGVLKGKGTAAASASGCAPTWTRCRWKRTPTCAGARPFPAAFMAAAMTATRPCCSAPRDISPRPAISTAPCISSSSRPRKASAARGP